MSDNVELGATCTENNIDKELEPLGVVIWECTKLQRYLSDNGEKRWRCLWCPKGDDGQDHPGFKGHHATKALWHVCQIAGKSIHICQGIIPAPYKKRYMNFYYRS